MFGHVLVLAQTDDGLRLPAAPHPADGGSTLSIQRLKDSSAPTHRLSEIELHAPGPEWSASPGVASRRSSRWSVHAPGSVIDTAAGMRVGVGNATLRDTPQRLRKKLIDQPRCARAADHVASSRRRAPRGDAPARATRGPCGRRCGRSTQATRSCSRAGDGVGNTDLQARPNHASRRSSASAATDTWRSRGCRACTARRRWPRSGRARANVMSLDVLRALTRSPRCARVFRMRGRARAGTDPRLDARVLELKDSSQICRHARDAARRVVESHGALPAGLAARAQTRRRQSPTPSERSPARRRRGPGVRARSPREWTSRDSSPAAPVHSFRALALPLTWGPWGRARNSSWHASSASESE